MKKKNNPSRDSSFKKPRAAKKRRPTSTDVEVGQSIRAHRLIAGLSQSDLARQLGVSFQQVQKYEKGANRVGAGRLPQIARIFNVPIGALFKDHAYTSPGGRTVIAERLIADAAALRLLTAYADITDQATRLRLSQLVDVIAKVERRNRR